METGKVWMEDRYWEKRIRMSEDQLSCIGIGDRYCLLVIGIGAWGWRMGMSDGPLSCIGIGEKQMVARDKEKQVALKDEDGDRI